MIRNILALRGRRIEDVMVPRGDIVAVQQDITIGELVKVFEKAGHSRLVVYNDTLDDPVGMVHIRDLIAFMTAQAAVDPDKPPRRKKPRAAGLDLGAIDLTMPLSSTKIMREMLFVPPSMPAIDLLAKMQATRIHLALVIDEYGGTDGLVSIEDIVEQIVGDIADEHDEDELPAVVAPAGRLVRRRRAREPRGRHRRGRRRVRRRRCGRGGRHARRLSGDPGRPGAGARRAGAGPGRLRDRGAGRRSAPGQEGPDLSQQGSPDRARPRGPPPLQRARHGGEPDGYAGARRRKAADAGNRFQHAAQIVTAIETPTAGFSITRLAHWIVLSWGWRRALIAFAAGAVSALALAPFNAWPVLFLTFPVLVWLIDGAAAGASAALPSAAIAGWWFGFGYFLAGLYWVGYAFLVDAQDLRLAAAVRGHRRCRPVLAIFTALRGCAGAHCSGRAAPLRILALAVALTVAEWLRGHLLTGFPWNAFGYALTGPLALAQGAALIGIWGLTFIAVAVFASPAVLTDERADTRRPGCRSRSASCCSRRSPATARCGSSRTPTAFVDGVRLRIMQPNLQQDEKFNYAAKQQVMSRYLELSDRADRAAIGRRARRRRI